MNHRFTLIGTDYTEKQKQKLINRDEGDEGDESEKQRRLNHGRHRKKRENTENSKSKGRSEKQRRCIPAFAGMTRGGGIASPPYGGSR